MRRARASAILRLVRNVSPVLVSALVLASCGGGAAEPQRHFGDVMSEVGRRFERAGRAAKAGRWELARYDLDELDEIFEDDVPHAATPPDVHADLQGLAHAFAVAHPPALRRAAAAHDGAAFEAAFRDAATACNACHAAAHRAFVEVPTTWGEPVPVVTPAP